MEAITRTISLLTADVKTRKVIAVNRMMMEEASNIRAKLIGSRSNAMWDIHLATKEAKKALAYSVLTTTTLRLQTEYMVSRKTWITLHWVPMYITADHLVIFFSDYGDVERVSSIRSKARIAASDLEIMVTLFNEVSNVIISGG